MRGNYFSTVWKQPGTKHTLLKWILGQPRHHHDVINHLIWFNQTERLCLNIILTTKAGLSLDPRLDGSVLSFCLQLH